MKITDNLLDKDRKYISNPPLRHLYFYITEGCNLACRHCWISPKFVNGGANYKNLPVHVFHDILLEAKPLGLKSVKLTGGEPLIHPEFIDLLNVINKENLSLVLETNGVRCNRQIALEISKVPNRFVSISLDGSDAQTHEWVRGVEGCFEKTCNAVRYLSDVHTPPQIIMTLMKHNVHQVERIIKLAEELGASSVKFNLVQPTARGKSIYRDNFYLPVKEILKIGKRIENELAPKTSLRLFFDYPLAFRPLKDIASGNGCSVCAIHTILGVLASGHYALCGIGSQVPELTFGTALRDSLESVWTKNETLLEIRNGLPKRLEGICSNCLMKGRCLGSCVAQNYYRTGSLWGPFWFCELAEKEGLFPATRSISAVPEAEAHKG